MNALFAWMYVYHMHAWCSRRQSFSLSFHLIAGNQTQVLLQEEPGLLTNKLSLQPPYVFLVQLKLAIYQLITYTVFGK